MPSPTAVGAQAGELAAVPRPAARPPAADPPAPRVLTPAGRPRSVLSPLSGSPSSRPRLGRPAAGLVPSPTAVGAQAGELAAVPRLSVVASTVGGMLNSEVDPAEAQARREDWDARVAALAARRAAGVGG